MSQSLSNARLRITEFLEDVQSESDRGAALVAAAKLDDALKDIILTFLLKDDASVELVNGKYAPLGNFSARINAAYALGLLDTNEYSTCHQVRRIRNKFSHSSSGLNFDSPEIRDLILNLSSGPLSDPESSLRQKFIGSSACLVIDLLWRSSIVKGDKRVVKNWPNKVG